MDTNEPSVAAVCAGVMLALDCMPEGAALHVYGFNWSRRHWLSHAIAAEERFVRRLAAHRRVVLHETACGGLRFCGRCNVVAGGGSSGSLAGGSASVGGANSNGEGGDAGHAARGDGGTGVVCSERQAESAGELTTEQLLFREPEASG